MRLDRDTYQHLIRTAVESYDNETAYYQGRVANNLLSALKNYKGRFGWLKWLLHGRWISKVTHTDVLEWVELDRVPKRLFWINHDLYNAVLYDIQKAAILKDFEYYRIARKYIGYGNENDEYVVTIPFYNWLVRRTNGTD